ncbi:MAG: trypsin-like peptidase domain-containing protein, partial [Verrucomicrobiota bacterium]
MKHFFRRSWMTVLSILLSLHSLFSQTKEIVDTNPIHDKALVRIVNYIQQPVWNAPWQFQRIQIASGTGFVIDGKMIMTNAHVISWSKNLVVFRYNDPRPFSARIVYRAHECDLALITVDDPTFFEGITPLTFGSLPKVRSTVTTNGYPAGGTQISYTRGVVSRIEMQNYAHIGNKSFLAVQTDAAINPGNSGGPVLQEGKVVGVAFQGIKSLEGAGFFIPTPVIRHFLKDIEDGKYDGFPVAGISIRTLESPAYRRYLGLPLDGRGIALNGILPIPSTQELLRFDDVLLEANGFPISSDGTIIYEGNRVQMGVAFNELQQGEIAKLKIWRDQKEISVNLPMTLYKFDEREGAQHDILPRYVVYGGLLFEPLSFDLIRSLGDNGSDIYKTLSYELFYRRFETPEHPRLEPVVLVSTFSHSANAELNTALPELIESINN